MKKNSVILDTNIIVRLLVGEPPAQLEKVLQLLSQVGKEFIVSDVIVAEAIFVLLHLYKVEKKLVVLRLAGLLELTNIVSNKQVLLSALEIFKENAVSFVDAYSYAQALDQERVLFSFDQKLQKIDKDFIKNP